MRHGLERGLGCLFTFKLNKRSTNLQVRLVLIFENSFQRENAVMRCMHHQTTEQLICPEHIISFACLSTRPGGINRRNVLSCCTLERKQRGIGRRTFKLKVSTCPGRERKTEENKLTENRQNSNKPAMNSRPNSLKRRVPFSESEETLTPQMGDSTAKEFLNVHITLRNPHLILYALMTKYFLEMQIAVIWSQQILFSIKLFEGQCYHQKVALSHHQLLWIIINHRIVELI